MARGDQTIKIYRRLAKKRYLKGKHMYEHERLCVPIPSRFHDIVKPFLNQRLKIEVANRGGGLVVALNPEKTFRHAENTPRKTTSKTRPIPPILT